MNLELIYDHFARGDNYTLVELIKNANRYGAGGVQSICPLNNFNSLHCIIIKLCENVCWQNISPKFDNQPDPKKHFRVMAL